MTTGQKHFIQLNSGDFSARPGDNAQSFRNTLAAPIKLDNDKNYEVALWDVMFPVEQDTASVYINCSLVQQAIVGSSQTSSLYWVPFTELTGPMGGSLYYTSALSRKWYPLAIKNIPYIDISFTLSTGAKMPVNPTDFSTVTIAFREVVY